MNYKKSRRDAGDGGRFMDYSEIRGERGFAFSPFPTPEVNLERKCHLSWAMDLETEKRDTQA